MQGEAELYPERSREWGLASAFEHVAGEPELHSEHRQVAPFALTFRDRYGHTGDSSAIQAAVLPYRLMPERSRRPRDANELAKQIVAEAVGDAPPYDPDAGKDPAAVALGRKGGLKGGKARAAKMSPEERTEAARKAAQARWQRPSE